MMKRRFVFSAGLLASFLSLVLLPATAVAQDEEAFVRYKYEVATVATKAYEKCGGLSYMAGAAASHAHDHYRSEMIALGNEPELEPFEQSLDQQFGNSSCDAMYASQELVQRMNEVQGLVDEYLLAVLRSGVTQCGDFRTEEILYAMRIASQAEERLKARPDYPYVDKFAISAGKDFSEDCENEIVNDAFLLSQTPVGNVFVQTIFSMD